MKRRLAVPALAWLALAAAIAFSRQAAPHAAAGAAVETHGMAADASGYNIFAVMAEPALTAPAVTYVAPPPGAQAAAEVSPAARGPAQSAAK